MPTPSQRASMIPYHLRSFLGGQSDYEDKGIAGSYKASANLDPRKQKDTLTCQQALKEDLLLGTLTATAFFMVPASDGNLYVFCHDGKIFRRKPGGDYTVNGTVQPVYTDTQESGNIIGAQEWFSQAGFTYLLWATPTRLNIKKIAGPAYSNTEPWNDVNTADTGSWPKTNLTSVTWHTMAVANGVLEICNGNVMAIVGYDLSYSNQGLALIPGNNSKLILERGKYGIIGCNNSAGRDESALFAWDGIGLSWNDKEIIKVGGINSMIDTEVALAQIGTDGLFYISDFNTPMPFRKIRGGGKSDPDGVTSYKGMALIGIYGNTNPINGGLANGVYSFGRVNKNAPLILNLEYQLDVDEITSVKTVGTDILIAYKSDDHFGIKIVDTANKATAIYQTLDLIAPLGTRRYPIPLGRLLGWNRVDLECQPLPAGCAIECWYRIDKANSGGPNDDGWLQANMDPSNPGNGLQFNTAGDQNAVFFLNERGRVIEVMLKLIPSGNDTPEVNEINVYFTVG